MTHAERLRNLGLRLRLHFLTEAEAVSCLAGADALDEVATLRAECARLAKRADLAECKHR